MTTAAFLIATTRVRVFLADHTEAV